MASIIYKLISNVVNQAINREQVMKYRDEICLNDLQSNIVNCNIRLKIVALKAF